MDISPSRTLGVFPKVSVLELVVSTTVVLKLLVRSLLIGRKKLIITVHRCVRGSRYPFKSREVSEDFTFAVAGLVILGLDF